jgi:RNA polymerase sigma-70 factor (ECF subfamily)
MPVFRFIRRNYADDAARDLTQEFFAQLLAHRGLDRVEQGKGRFRSYLLGAVKHFLGGQKERAEAAKRGGGQVPVPLEVGADTHTTTTLQVIDPAAPVPDAFFDRQWALSVIDHALNALATELTSAGKGNYFETLKPWLAGEVTSLSQSDAARQLGLTDGAVKVAIHRLRKRFRDLVKEEIAGTVDQPAAIEEELHYLLEALAQT